MVIYIDYDDTIVLQDHDYADLAAPLHFLPFAKEGLLSLKAANHDLVLWSARASRSLLFNPELNPLVRAGVLKLNQKRWDASRDLNWARYDQMVDFVNRELPGVFAAIDDGAQGKPSPVDLFIEDRCGHSVDWHEIAALYGAPLPPAPPPVWGVLKPLGDPPTPRAIPLDDDDEWGDFLRSKPAPQPVKPGQRPVILTPLGSPASPNAIQLDDADWNDFLHRRAR